MEAQTFTRRLSRAIDDAFEAYRPGEPDSEAKLYAALLAQARNVAFHRSDRSQVAMVAQDNGPAGNDDA
jgi:hypothetical protein